MNYESRHRAWHAVHDKAAFTPHSTQDAHERFKACSFQFYNKSQDIVHHLVAAQRQQLHDLHLCIDSMDLEGFNAHAAHAVLMYVSQSNCLAETACILF